MRLFGEITKIEDQPDGSLKVFGVASSGARDDVGEIVQPEAMKAALPDYARYPALREMHQPSAAGRTLEAQVDEDGVTRIVAHVVDPVAVAKVKSKTYAGFSIGGRVLARDPADPTVITRIRLSEISLVDRPANPEAVIDLWKADPALDAPPAGPDNESVKGRAAAMARSAGRPKAWKDFVARARSALIAEAADAPGALLSKADDADDDEAEEDEATPNGDTDSSIDESDAGAVDDDAEDSAADDGDDGADDMSFGDNVAARLAELAQQDPDAIQAAHDALAALGAACDPANCQDVEKRLNGDDLARALPRLAALERRLATQAELIERLAAAPAPPKTATSGHVRAVGKTEDADPMADDLAAADAQKAFAVLTPDERAFLLMKTALRQPIPVG